MFVGTRIRISCARVRSPHNHTHACALQHAHSSADACGYFHFNLFASIISICFRVFLYPRGFISAGRSGRCHQVRAGQGQGDETDGAHRWPAHQPARARALCQGQTDGKCYEELQNCRTAGVSVYHVRGRPPVCVINYRRQTTYTWVRTRIQSHICLDVCAFECERVREMTVRRRRRRHTFPLKSDVDMCARVCVRVRSAPPYNCIIYLPQQRRPTAPALTVSLALSRSLSPSHVWRMRTTMRRNVRIRNAGAPGILLLSTMRRRRRLCECPLFFHLPPSPENISPRERDMLSFCYTYNILLN